MSRHVFGHTFRHVFRHVFRRVLRHVLKRFVQGNLAQISAIIESVSSIFSIVAGTACRVDMCIDMFADMCMDMGIDICV